jgi:hypothetical protein
MNEPCIGYALFETNHSDTPLEIQRCDSCGKYDTDDQAAVCFVRDLERGQQWAMEMARMLTGENTTGYCAPGC